MRDPNAPVFDFQLNPEKAELSATTLKIYRGNLNKIAAASYAKSLTDKRKKPIMNKKDLLTKHKQVVDIINEVGDSRASKCALYSAVFYAVGKKDLAKNKKMGNLVDEFHKIYYNDDYKEYLEKQKALKKEDEFA
jgi:hypothetical protein